MKTPGKIARNVAFNWAGMAVEMLAGFLVAPFLVHHLGQEIYGLWVLVASLAGYFGLLDLGMRSSVGRQIAFYVAKGEEDNANRMLSTAFAILCAAGLLALFGTAVIVLGFSHVLNVPAEELANTRIALMLVGLNLALALPLSVFDASLWAGQRFDLLNLVDIPSVVARAGLTFLLVGQGHGLVALACLTLGIMLANSLAKAVLTFHVQRHTRLRPSFVSRQAAKGLLGYGFWSFVLATSRIVVNQVTPVIVASALGLAFVTLFNICTRMMAYAVTMFSAGTGVLTPLATALHAENKHREQRRLFLRGGQYCAALACGVVTGFIVFGGPFVRLWMGPSFESSAQLLQILVVGESLSMCQWAGVTMALGMGRHKVLALASTAETVTALISASILGPLFGLTGVCVGLAASALFCRGLVQLIYCCRLANTPLRDYLLRSILPPILVGLVPGLGFGLLVHWQPPASWLGLIGVAFCYGLSYLAACGILIGWHYRIARKEGASMPVQLSLAAAAASEVQP